MTQSCKPQSMTPVRCTLDFHPYSPVLIAPQRPVNAGLTLLHFGLQKLLVWQELAGCRNTLLSTAAISGTSGRSSALGGDSAAPLLRRPIPCRSCCLCAGHSAAVCFMLLRGALASIDSTGTGLIFSALRNLFVCT